MTLLIVGFLGAAFGGTTTYGVVAAAQPAVVAAASPPAVAWSYPARCERAIDGDTLSAEVAIAPDLKADPRIRLAGVDTPELRGAEREAGLAAKAYAEGLLDCGAEGWPLTVTVSGVDSFGRWLATVSTSEGDVGTQLIEAGHGERWSR